MYVKLLVAGTALAMALAAIPSVAAETTDECLFGNILCQESESGQCVVEDVGCYCSDPINKSCGGLTGTKNCVASAGPTPGIQVGVLCDYPLGA